MCWPVIHACCDHCTTPYWWPHSRQTWILMTRRINLLTATVQSEIKSNDPWYRPNDYSVIPRYIIYNNLGIPRYMMILLYPGIWRSCYTAVNDDFVIPRYMTIFLYHGIWRSWYTAEYDNLAMPRYMTILLYRGIGLSCYTAVYDDLVIPRYMAILLHRFIMMILLYPVCERYVVIMLPWYRNMGHIFFYTEKLIFFS